MSGIFGATVIKGTRITDFTNTSASVGNVIPWGVGRFVAPGNVIWAPLPPKEQRKVVRQGKGGVKQETFTYTLSYSIAFSKGPIYGFWWIKRNGKIVYTRDPNAPAEDQQYAAKWLQRATLYNGGEDQLPDSTIESYEGMGQVTAHKDISSIVVEDDDVTNEGGAVPSYEACVIATPPEAYLTSKVYPQLMASDARLAARPVGGNLVRLLYESNMQPDEAELGVAPVGGDMFEVPPPEFLDEAELDLAPVGGELKEPPPYYFDDAAELGAEPTAGNLAVPPLGTMQDDEVDIGLGPTGGALVTAAYSSPSLFHFDGADDSTVFADEYGKSWVANGNVKISTAQSKFGGASAYFDGQGDYLSPALPDMSLDNTVVTVELWAWLPNPASWPIPTGNAAAYSSDVLGQSNTGSSGEQDMGVATDGSMFLNLNRGSPGNAWSSAAGVVPWEQWVHLAWVIDTNEVRGYVDGVQVFSATTSRKWAALATPLTIGYSIVSGYPQYKRFWNGYMDELRIRQEVMYTANFTPPSSPFTD